MKNLLIVGLLICFIYSCNSQTNVPKGWKQLNINVFSINVPVRWQPDTSSDQEDSYIGRILAPKAVMNFDCSTRGYANPLEIEAPNKISDYNLRIDSDKNYCYKTIWPKIPGKGMTGIYIHSRSNSFNFQMNGKNLSLKDQELALQAFETIKFKNQ